MEARAYLRYARISPRKVQIVLDLIRNKPVGVAMGILKNTPKAASEYLDKSKKIFYKDPELHFMYAKYNLDFKNYEIANYYIDECLKILPDYYPVQDTHLPKSEPLYPEQHLPQELHHHKQPEIEIPHN